MLKIKQNVEEFLTRISVPKAQLTDWLAGRFFVLLKFFYFHFFPLSLKEITVGGDLVSEELARRKKRDRGGVVYREVIDGRAGITSECRRAVELTQNCLNQSFSRTFLICSLILAWGSWVDEWREGGRKQRRDVEEQKESRSFCWIHLENKLVLYEREMDRSLVLCNTMINGPSCFSETQKAAQVKPDALLV